MPPRPNLLVIGTDQHRWYDLGCTGNPGVQTPNIDRLAHQGTRFSHSFVTYPLCVPSRASCWTGQYPHTLGVIHNDDGPEIFLPDRHLTLGDVLKAEGYRCGYLGKWHVGREGTPQHGFTDAWVTFLRDSYEDWLEASGEWTAPEGVRSLDRRGHVPFELAHDTVVTTRTLEFISVHRDEPWFAVCGMRAPHDPYIGPFDHLYSPADVPLPESVTETFAGKPLCQATSWGAGYRDALGVRTPEDFRPIIARYWGLIHLIDLNVGRLLDHLEALGLADRTVVMFWVDHGDMMGAHNLLSKGPFMYEETNRVPVIFRGPGVAAGRLVEDLASVVDYAPTLLELLGVRAPAAMQGRSLAAGEPGPQARAAAAREVVFAETFETYRQKRPIFMARTPRWKFNYHLGDINELYDLESDPHEMHNLAELPQHYERVCEMQLLIRDWLLETGDVRLSELLGFL